MSKSRRMFSCSLVQKTAVIEYLENGVTRNGASDTFYSNDYTAQWKWPRIKMSLTEKE